MPIQSGMNKNNDSYMYENPEYSGLMPGFSTTPSTYTRTRYMQPTDV